jgi:hypothetical protein
MFISLIIRGSDIVCVLSDYLQESLGLWLSLCFGTDCIQEKFHDVTNVSPVPTGRQENTRILAENPKRNFWTPFRPV